MAPSPEKQKCPPSTQNRFCPQLSTRSFINSLTIQLGRLRKSPPLRGVLLAAGNVWTAHPRRPQCVFTEAEAARRLEPAWVYAGGLDPSEHILSGTVTKGSLPVHSQLAQACGMSCSRLPRPPPGSASPGPASAVLFRSHPEPTSQPCHGRPQHLAGLPPPRARPSDAGETRAHSAGQRLRFLSKCLWPGFLLTEGRLQLASDTPRGGSRGPSLRARPAGTRRGGCSALRQLSDDIHGDTGVRPPEPERGFLREERKL